MRSKTVAVLCTVISIAAVGGAQAVQYQIRDLGTLGGGVSYAKDINNNGQVVGWAHTSNGDAHAFSWQNGSMTDLGRFSGLSNSEAIAISNNGKMLINAYMFNGPVHQFVLQQNCTSSELGISLNLEDINDSGQVASGAINNNGLVASTVNLGTLPGTVWSSAEGINDNGQIVGTAGTGILPSGGYNHGFIWDNGVTTDLGTLGGGDSYAQAVNDSNQVVGSAWTRSGEQHAFVWKNGTMTDLGTLPGGHNSYAWSINDNGWIVGYSTFADQTAYHAVLWEPVPEPSSILTLLLGIGGLGAIMRRRLRSA